MLTLGCLDLTLPAYRVTSLFPSTVAVPYVNLLWNWRFLPKRGSAMHIRRLVIPEHTGKYLKLKMQTDWGQTTYLCCFSKYWFIFGHARSSSLQAGATVQLWSSAFSLWQLLLLWLLDSIPRGMGWRGQWEEGSGWRGNVYLWPIHTDVWQNPSQYCKVIILQLKKKKKTRRVRFLGNFFPDFRCAWIWPSTPGLSIGQL